MPFKRLFTLVCRHQYFAGQLCRGIRVQPTAACIRLMQRYRLLYRQEGDGGISVLKDEPASGKCPVPDCKESFSFYLLANDSSFFTYTSLKPVGPGNMLVYSNSKKPGDATLKPVETEQWEGSATIPMLFGGVSILPPAQFVTYAFSLDTPSIPWQYFVVAKNATEHYRVEGSAVGITFQPVADAGKLQASPLYQSIVQTFPDAPVFWYQSDAPLPLAQQVRSRIQLINTDTQTVLIENLPNPTPADNGVKMIYL